MRRLLLGALLVVGVLGAPAMAEARQLTPQDRTDAVRFAKRYWAERMYYASDEGCGRVRTKVGWRDPDTGGRLSDTGIVGYWHPYDHCRLVLNGANDWSAGGTRDPWWDLCVTVIHEYGHLVGKRHSWSNPDSIMAGSVELHERSWWYPYFPDCRYDGDDEDGDGWPDW